MKNLNTIVDRRNFKGKSAENRKKFLDRVRDSIRESMPTILNKGNLKDIGKEGGSVEIKRKTIQEPSIRFGKGGSQEHILPGNKEYVKGDQLKKPQGQGGGSGNKASNNGEGEDPFVVQISREEFLNYLFEDLELPDLVRKELSTLSEKKPRNAGYATTGNPSKLALIKSMKMAYLRKIAIKGARKLAEQENVDEVDENVSSLIDKPTFKKIPFIDPIDLRYRSTVQDDKPITAATMVCIMDNSGSMGEYEKTLSRKFFYLLYLFLTKKYEKIDLVFIHHTDKAKEVSEEEFFNTKESGGTVVSSALVVLKDLLSTRIDYNKTNIYVCQCSDGDNYGNDNSLCTKLLEEELLPKVQYWAYIQIAHEKTANQYHPDDSLWQTYNRIAMKNKNLVLQDVGGDADIYPVFRKLFEKKPHK